MKRKPSQTAVWFLVNLLLVPCFAPCLEAQTAPPPPSAAPAAMPTPAQLDQLLAPVALYPDSLLAQITTAATDPQQILDFDNWLAQNSALTGEALATAAQKQGFDPAFLALAAFPQVVQMMAENIDDYATIGQAFTADQGAVTASIQRLRSQAYAAGSLRTTSQQDVQVQQSGGTTTYVIQPANPQVVYVPVYNPTVVYAQPSTGALVATSVLTFGVGIGIGWLIASNQPWGWGGWGWGWGPRGGVYYNRAVWGGWHGGYRPPNPWYRPRPVPYNSRPGYGGNWGYRPPNYRPPNPVNRPVYRPPGTRPGYRPPNTRPGGTRPGGTYPGNRPGGTQPGTRPGGTQPGTRPGGTQPGNRPGGTQPGTRPGGTQPGTRPGGTQPGNRPGGTQPGTRPGGAQPGTRPGTPSQPGGTRPSPSTRPAPSTRPGGTTRPQNSGQPRPGSGQPGSGNAQRPQARPGSPQNR